MLALARVNFNDMKSKISYRCKSHTFLIIIQRLHLTKSDKTICKNLHNKLKRMRC